MSDPNNMKKIVFKQNYFERFAFPKISSSEQVIEKG